MCLLCAQDGDLVLHIMNKAYRVQYKEGDMVTFRSAIVMHEVMPFIGQRSAIVLFNKKNTVKYIQTKERPSRPFGKQAEELDTDIEAEQLKVMAREERALAREENEDPNAVHLRAGGGCRA
jgi:predicted 2-oxoglutarate/Fe(II)-dependent dioxygenase YbiX